jgi:hypothetical protein
MDAPKQYMEELRSELGFYPTWLPTAAIELGTFGTLHRGVFRRAGSLRDLAIDFTIKPGATKSSFKKHRGMQFRIRSEIKAEVGPVDAAVGVELSSRRAYAWAFAAAGARLDEIDDILPVATAILQTHRTGLWKREWLLVTEVEHVDRLSVVIAKSTDVKGEIVAKAKIADGSDILLCEESSYRFASSDVFVVENAKATTPLYGLRALRGTFRRGLEPISGGDGGKKVADDDLSLQRANDAPMFFEGTE